MKKISNKYSTLFCMLGCVLSYLELIYMIYMFFQGKNALCFIMLFGIFSAILTVVVYNCIKQIKIDLKK